MHFRDGTHKKSETDNPRTPEPEIRKPLNALRGDAGPEKNPTTLDTLSPSSKLKS